MLLLSGSPVEVDIQPTSGTVHFISGLSSRSFIISILPDDIPEITEVRLFLLTACCVRELTSCFSVAGSVIHSDDN